MKRLQIPISDAFRRPASAAAPRDITSSDTTGPSLSATDALVTRRLLVTMCLGFSSFVAAILTTIPEWTGLVRYAWLAVCLLAFGGSLVFLVGALAAFAPRHRP
jgi:hypothetical protein